METPISDDRPHDAVPAVAPTKQALDWAKAKAKPGRSDPFFVSMSASTTNGPYVGDGWAFSGMKHLMGWENTTFVSEADFDRAAHEVMNLPISGAHHELTPEHTKALKPKE